VGPAAAAAATWRYAAAVLRGNAPRHLGHNPLGAWMAITLLACVRAMITGRKRAAADGDIE